MGQVKFTCLFFASPIRKWQNSPFFPIPGNMHQFSHTLSIQTRGRGLYVFTHEVIDWIQQSGIQQGLLTLFIRHTSASLLVQENYDPDVQTDLERFFARLVPDGDPMFQHTIEGEDDMPAHVRAALTQTSLSIPVNQGEPMLGTWQGIYLYEHRLEPQHRQVLLHLIGE
jgi:secondary thiamine-phosphate synthase enzyme